MQPGVESETLTSSPSAVCRIHRMRGLVGTPISNTPTVNGVSQDCTTDTTGSANR
jgi:hypothetical protein